MAERSLTAREQALWILVRASHQHADSSRGEMVREPNKTLTPEEHFLATMVIALFNFYNQFVDLNGVDVLTPEGYAASGVRLFEHGYLLTSAPKPG